MTIDPFYAPLFFTLLATVLIACMVFLIKDLDNPFDYNEKGERKFHSSRYTIMSQP